MNHESWCHYDMDCCGCTCRTGFPFEHEDDGEDTVTVRCGCGAIHPTKEKKMPFTLYVCGPMTGLPELNFPAFFEAEKKLKDAGYAVLNPADRAGRRKDAPWTWYLRSGVQDVTLSDGIALLPGWEESKGACLEVDVARALEIPKTTVAGWVYVAPKFA